MRHYITKYEENGIKYAEAWLQINLFHQCFCFWKVRIKIWGPRFHETLAAYFLSHLCPDSWVGGRRSPGSMWTVLGFGTCPPRGPTSEYVPRGLLSSPGLYKGLAICLITSYIRYQTKQVFCLIALYRNSGQMSRYRWKNILYHKILYALQET